MKKYLKQPWTELERKTLAVFYYHESIDDLMERIPNRSENAIRKQVMYLKKRGYRFK
jgi:hypothetical protein